MFLRDISGHDRVDEKTYKIIVFLLEFINIWKDMEIGENFKIDHKSVFGYVNHLNSVAEFWECETRDDFFAVFEDMAINSKLHLFQFITLTKWQRKIIKDEFKDIKPSEKAKKQSFNIKERGSLTKIGSRAIWEK